MRTRDPLRVDPDYYINSDPNYSAFADAITDVGPAPSQNMIAVTEMFVHLKWSNVRHLEFGLMKVKMFITDINFRIEKETILNLFKNL